jgi:hypothetical protein
MHGLVDFVFCSPDIKECSADSNPCSQHCVEEEGGYSCVCSEKGYQLDTDKATCVGA